MSALKNGVMKKKKKTEVKRFDHIYSLLLIITT